MTYCKLLAGPLTYILQVTLGCMALSVLYVKWRGEYPKRTKKVFAFDISKQVIGMGFAHIINMGIAFKLGHNKDECRWYFINYFIDVTLGTLCNYGLLYGVKRIAFQRDWDMLDMGTYQHSTRKCNLSYLVQLCTWLGIISMTKLILYTSILIPAKNNLNNFGEWILLPVSSNESAELAVVMVLFPLIFNIAQFWIQDTFLKGKCHYVEKPYTITDNYTSL